MRQHVLRANLLLQQERFPEAIEEVKKALADDPNESIALAILAEAQLATRQYKEGLESAQMAIRQDPSSSGMYSVLGKAQFFNKQMDEARKTLREGLRLDPRNTILFYWLGRVDWYEEKWEEALDSVERGLAIDPENVHLLNFRSQLLIKLRRTDEANETIDHALREAPENTASHSNKGWVAIHQDNYQEAVLHFKEALRLDPTNEFAKGGLKEAIKGKNLLYRGVLKYFLWMNQLQSKFQWGVIIGLYILYRLLLNALEHFPILAPLLYPLIVAYILFAFSTWIAQPISNLCLRFHSLGKLALTDDERQASNWVAALLGVALLLLVLFFTVDPTGVSLWLAIVFGLMMIPVSGIFYVPAGSKARRNLTIYALLLGACGIFYGFNPSQTWAMMGFSLGVLFYSFVAVYLIKMSAKEF